MKKFTFILFAILSMSMSLSAQTEKPVMCVVLEDTMFAKNEVTSKHEAEPAEYYCLYVYEKRIVLCDSKAKVKKVIRFTYSKDLTYASKDDGLTIDFENKMVYCDFKGMPAMLFRIDASATLEMAKEMKIID